MGGDDILAAFPNPFSGDVFMMDQCFCRVASVLFAGELA
jgi:hypothetical protein